MLDKVAKAAYYAFMAQENLKNYGLMQPDIPPFETLSAVEKAKWFKVAEAVESTSDGRSLSLLEGED